MNKDEELYYAGMLMYHCRCDWSDGSQVRDWLEEAKIYLPENLSLLIDEDYIMYTCEDGRYARDAFPNYDYIFSLVNEENLTKEFKEEIDNMFPRY